MTYSERVSLPEGADAIFTIWLGEPELRWAARAWEELGKQKLVGPNVFHTTVLLRLLSLGALYHTFCQRAWEESSIALLLWADDIGLPEGHLRFADSEDVSAHALLDVEDLLHLHVKRESEVVLAALRKAWGESELFASLWLSRDEEWSGKVPLPADVLYDVVNTGFWEKGPAYEWLTTDGSPDWE